MGITYDELHAKLLEAITMQNWKAYDQQVDAACTANGMDRSRVHSAEYLQRAAGVHDRVGTLPGLIHHTCLTLTGERI